MTDDSLVFRSAAELAALIRQGQLTAVQVVEAHLAQIQRHNPALHAVTWLYAKEARAAAAAADRRQAAGEPLGVLHGVPMTIKDSLRVRGLRSTFGGAPPYYFYVPKSDSTLAERLRSAGCIFMGRSNLPFLGLDWQTRNPLFKEAKNPWDLARTPGGSSGGAAAALAAGLTPIELGSDLGGSIRYPAHCCGVLGLRTSEGLLPISDMGPEGLTADFTHMMSFGPMARSLGDLALLLDVLTAASAPSARLDPGGERRPLRIAITRSLPGAEPSRETLVLLDKLTVALRRDGHSVQLGGGPELPSQDAWRIWGTISGHLMWRSMPSWLRGRLGQRLYVAYMLRHNLGDGPFTTWFQRGMQASPAEYEASLIEHAQQLQVVDSFFSKTDLWILPVAMGEAIRRQPRGDAIQVGGQAVPYSLYLGAYTVPTTAYGTPVLTAPIGYADSGLPIGVQVHGARRADRRLLELCQQALSPYITVRPPPLVAAAAAG